MLMIVEIDYKGRSELRKRDPEVIKKVFNIVGGDLDKYMQGLEYALEYKEFIIDDEQAKFLSDNKIPFVVNRFKGTIELNKLVDSPSQPQSVTIHVPNYSLHAVRYVEVHEDLYTQDLQTRLNDGWIIIAVCPPLDQRRPTYILGKHTR